MGVLSRRMRWDAGTGAAELQAGMHALVQGAAPIGAAARQGARVTLDGKFFRLGAEKFWIKGVTYGPFEPQASGVALPVQHQLEADLRQIRGLGANTIRVYHVPPRELLDTAHAFGLKVFVTSRGPSTAASSRAGRIGRRAAARCGRPRARAASTPPSSRCRW